MGRGRSKQVGRVSQHRALIYVTVWRVENFTCCQLWSFVVVVVVVVHLLLLLLLLLAFQVVCTQQVAV